MGLKCLVLCSLKFLNHLNFCYFKTLFLLKSLLKLLSELLIVHCMLFFNLGQHLSFITILLLVLKTFDKGLFHKISLIFNLFIGFLSIQGRKVSNLYLFLFGSNGSFEHLYLYLVLCLFECIISPCPFLCNLPLLLENLNITLLI